ncbi:MAG: ion channel [Oscillospiraceae bacterium]|nr:ion channel [Oscillospiraceae bacterium]
MKKRVWRNAAVLLLAYYVLLQLMVYFEASSEDPSITSLPLALWYSLVTMTTVGYGDLYPVTIAGKVIGVLFLLLSAGALTALITYGVSWVSGTGLPRMKLKHIRDKKVYIFDGSNNAAQILSAYIHEEEPEAVCVFSAKEKLSSGTGISVSLPIPEVLKSLDAALPRPTVLYLGTEAETHLSEDGVPENADVVCATPNVPEELHDGQSYFDYYDLCASVFWREHPLEAKNQKVVLVGFGKLGRRLLEYALENCVFSPVRVTEYHMFGANEQFLPDHPCLGNCVSIGCASAETDSLFLHDDVWNASEELLLNADRIIFCSDDENENLSNYHRLKTYFPYQGTVSLYCTSCVDASLPVFGSDRELYTPRAVIRSGLTLLAKGMHEIYRKESGGQAPAWEELPSFLRKSNYASAEHLREKVRYLLDDCTLTQFSSAQMREAYERFLIRTKENPDLYRRIEHDRWVRFHAMYNWRYAPIRDNPRRLHPLLVPYEALSAGEQAKDDYSWLLIGKLAEQIESGS